MGLYETLKRESPIPIDEKAALPDDIMGIYIESHSAEVILLNKNIQTTTEKTCVLAEEIGHYYTTVGDISDQTNIANRKQERCAREWGYFRLVPLSAFIHAHRTGICNRFELADFLGVTENFLQAAIDRYREKYGKYVSVDGYTLCLEPLGVLEMFE